MKTWEFASILLAFMQLTTSSEISEWVPASEVSYGPVCHDPTTTYLVPDITNCRSYFRCTDGIPTGPLRCPPAFMFIPDWGCDMPDLLPPTAECLGNAALTTTAAPLPSCANASDGTYIPDQDSCTEFYICLNGVTIPETCPTGLSFNPTTWTCVPFADLPPDTPCLQTPAPSTTTASPPTTCSNATDGTYIPDLETCETFYICLNGSAIPQNCPSGLYFNPVTSTCVSYSSLPPETPCLQTPPPSTSVAPTTVAPPTTCSNATDGTYLPDLSDCQIYYICSGGNATAYTCPSGLFFNPETSRCGPYDSLPPSAPCLQTPEPSTTARPTPPTCSNATDGTYLPDPEDCQLYYVCVGGNATAYSCPSGLLFNPDTLRCVSPADMPSNATCLQFPGPSTPNPEKICENQPDGTYLPDIRNCSNFYICTDGEAYSVTCPAGLVFHPDLVSCVPPNELPPSAECQESPWEKCKSATNGTYLEHPQDCNKFIVCYSGEPVEYKCPPDLVFYPTGIECLYPWQLPDTHWCSGNASRARPGQSEARA